MFFRSKKGLTYSQLCPAPSMVRLARELSCSTFLHTTQPTTKHNNKKAKREPTRAILATGANLSRKETTVVTRNAAGSRLADCALSERDVNTITSPNALRQADSERPKAGGRSSRTGPFEIQSVWRSVANRWDRRGAAHADATFANIEFNWDEFMSYLFLLGEHSNYVVGPFSMPVVSLNVDRSICPVLSRAPLFLILFSLDSCNRVAYAPFRPSFFHFYCLSIFHISLFQF